MAGPLLQPGRRFGEYTEVRLLGKGGMGEVHLLKHDSGRLLAGKILYPRVIDEHPEFVQRFVREANFAMSIRHPNIATVYSAGCDPDTGYHYLIMEYLPRGTLRERLDHQDRFEIAEAADIVRQVASALVVAQSRNVVHRDIKPDNIMFSASGVPKLVDLGIAKFYGDVAGAASDRTAVMLVGTPAYMAPEQMKDARKVDIRADIYSLGVVFFEMLTGRRPYEGITVIELLAKAVRGESLPDVRTYRPEVPVQIAQLLLQMCHPDPARRIGTPKQVVDVFNRVSHSADTLTLLSLRDERVGTANRIVKIEIAVTAAALAAILGIYFIRRARTNARSAARADEAAETVRTEPY